MSPNSVTNNNSTVWDNNVYDGSTAYSGSSFFSDVSEDTIVFKNTRTVNNLIPPGALVTALAASLIIGTSPSFAHPDTWVFDRYITPNHPHLLGLNDVVYIYREFHDSAITPSPLPVVAATLTEIVGWGRDLVEFGLRDHNTGCTHRKTLTLPRSATRLSRKQWWKGTLSPYPAPSNPPPYPGPPHKPTSRGRRDSISSDRDRRGRVPRDSNNLPMWDKR
ncbi:hypothetical protein P692DRAFT_20879424 [Suillus brevipes Sb2]|nr:hypothetical protein P692DRAFT_201871098 [Suillus brevipes Sb2]KAG2747089.1 hypothetical protein P692DRAFT_20879424 [Suillus brevipes Sb2]